jgi:hypothetical protein
MTLFDAVGGRAPFADVLGGFFGGKPHALTIEMLGAGAA